jgi:hypothetical protein
VQPSGTQCFGFLLETLDTNTLTGLALTTSGKLTSTAAENFKHQFFFPAKIIIHHLLKKRKF